MRELQIKYQKGRIPFRACQSDPRFSYCLYIPESAFSEPNYCRPVVAVIHGSSRTAESFRDAFIEFAEQHNCIILAPLFPIGIPSLDSTEDYKLRRNSSERYDELLLAMLAEVSKEYCILSKFYLYGFSGGAQFAHRFFYLQSQSLYAVSIAAPGQVTLIESEKEWESGTADIEQLFGRKLDQSSMAQVIIQLVVGEADDELLPIHNSCTQSCRRSRLQHLHENYLEQGFKVQKEIVPEIGHDGFALLPATQRFFSQLLSR